MRNTKPKADLENNDTSAKPNDITFTFTHSLDNCFSFHRLFLLTLSFLSLAFVKVAYLLLELPVHQTGHGVTSLISSTGMVSMSSTFNPSHVTLENVQEHNVAPSRGGGG